MLNLDFVVWQFVRIMVDLEKNITSKNLKYKKQRNQPVFKDWNTKWKSLDQELTNLQKVDHLAYSKLMMQESINVSVKSKAQLNEVITSVDNIVRELSKLLKNEKNISQKYAFEFEKKELNKLKNDLVLNKTQLNT